MNCFIKKNCWLQDIEKKEYLIALMKGILVFGTIAWLFYDSWIPFLLFPIYLAGYLRIWIAECSRKKEAQFCLQFQDSMRSLAGSLRAGYSVENALRDTVGDMRMIYGDDARIQREFLQILRQLNMNISLEEAMRGFAERVPQEDVESFVTVFLAAGKAGGDSIAVIQNTVKILYDKMEVHREIQTLIAAKQLEFRVMSGVPFGMILYMRLAFGDFMRVLYGNLLGVTIMTGCLAVYLAAWSLGKKIVEIEL
ncbi:MAG: type II secretion system protein F [Hespellia sp.]|jgi:tight adherence protein B|nr:type II secretion system protein F [Hespellia sp.]